MIPSTNLHQFDVHNDGYFSHLLLTYVGGVILEMDVQRMPYEEFAVYLEEKCGCYFQERFGRLNLYLDYLDMNILEYLSQAITYDIDGCVYKKIGPPKKRYCNEFPLMRLLIRLRWRLKNQMGVEATRTSTTEVDATDGVEARTSTTKVDATDGVDSKTDKGKRSNDDDSDYQSVDYLSPGEEELIELRNRIKANREANAKVKDNLVSEMNEPNDENSMPADNVRDETFEEHDIYMNELLKSLKTADKDRIIEDPFISVEKHVERLVKSMSGEVRVVAKYGQRPPRNFNFGSLVNYKWITKVFGEKIRANPDIRLCDIADLVMKKYKCKVSPTQCTNAKKYALTEYEKTVGEHYAMLRSYGKALLDSNLRSTIKLGVTVNPDGKTYFDRFYVCFAGLADGWKARCRKIIALDGCFLKSPNQGEILTAIGRDGNNHIYLGLIEVVKYVMPNAEHGQCARHIYENFRKQYPGLKFTQLFWAISKASQDATQVVEVRRSMVESDFESEYDSDDDSDYQSNKSVNYLSPSEEELIKLINMMKANREAKAKAKDNLLLKSLKTADKDGITEDPFISIEKHVERYPMYDETTHWRLRKPKVGEKYVSVTQFKECLTYYALANGFSLWYERSYEARVVAKCGQRPPRLSNPKKGKQRKQTRYPSASIDELSTCPWRCYAGWMTDEKTFQCISLEDEHTCVRNFNFGSLVTISELQKSLVIRLGLTQILGCVIKLI
ncbi:hypothetical protein Tco_0200109 [Tanacetum coccineum]